MPAETLAHVQCAESSADEQYEAFDQHQASAARLDFAEEARTILEVAR